MGDGAGAGGWVGVVGRAEAWAGVPTVVADDRLPERFCPTAWPRSSLLWCFVFFLTEPGRSRRNFGRRESNPNTKSIRRSRRLGPQPWNGNFEPLTHILPSRSEARGRSSSQWSMRSFVLPATPVRRSARWGPSPWLRSRSWMLYNAPAAATAWRLVPREHCP